VELQYFCHYFISFALLQGYVLMSDEMDSLYCAV